MLRHRSAWFFPALGRRIRRSSARSDSEESSYSNELMNRTARAEEWRSTNRRHPVRTVVGGPPHLTTDTFSSTVLRRLLPDDPAASMRGLRAGKSSSSMRVIATSVTPARFKAGQRSAGQLVSALLGMSVRGAKGARNYRFSRGRAAPMSSLAATLHCAAPTSADPKHRPRGAGP